MKQTKYWPLAPLAAVAIWAVGVRLLRRGAPAGSTTLIVVALMALERFLVEFVRAKDDRLLGGFTIAQLISIAVIVGAVGWMSARSRRRVAA